MENMLFQVCTCYFRKVLYKKVVPDWSNSKESSSSVRLFMNEGWPLSGHERVTEARLLLTLLI